MTIADFTMPVVYKCKDGYTIDGDASQVREQVGVCSAQGVFSVSPCVPVVCGYGNIEHGPHASIDGDERDFIFGETVSVQCNAGWEIADSESGSTAFNVECLATGSFSSPLYCQNIDDCVGHTCGAHGVCVDGIEDYSCNCQEGFEENLILGEKICGNIDDCNGVSCGSAGTCTDLVSSFVCECGEGNTNEIEGDSSSACVPFTCRLEILENTQMEDIRTLSLNQVAYVKCLNGYTTDTGADFPLTCSANPSGVYGQGLMGPLTGDTIPVCVPSSCGLAPPLVYAAITPDYTHNFVYQESAQYTCAGGAPEIRFECGPSGWTVPGIASGAYYTCQNTCGQPARPLNGQRSGVGAVFHPQSAELSCDDGYTHLNSGAFSSDSSRLTQQCLATGQFEAFGSEVSVDVHGRVECKAVRCQRQDPPFHWQWSGDGDFDTRTPAILECEDGYSSNGLPHALTTQSVICNGDGTQSLFPSPCLPITHRIVGEVSDAVSGNLLRNAAVVVTDSSGAEHSLTTDSNGVWRMDSLMRGTVTITVTLTSYSDMTYTVNLQGDLENGPADAALNPHLEAQSWRVVLTWATNPRDLDGHVTRHPGSDAASLNDPGSQRTHLYWRNTWMGALTTNPVFWWIQTRDATKPSAMLDRDNVQGNGVPETITYFQMESCINDCKFVYRVWDYCSLPTALVDDSQALVRLYNSDGLHSQYEIGTSGMLHNAGYEHRWDVFSLDATGSTVQVDECLDATSCPADNTYAPYNHGSC